MRKPKPVPIPQECDLCGQPWDEHGDTPTTDDCIRLLKMALVLKSPVCLLPHYPCVKQHVTYPWGYTWNPYPNTPWYVSSQSKVAGNAGEII